MGLKDMLRFGKSNLTDNASRIEALGEARRHLGLLGFAKRIIDLSVGHERDHLFALPDHQEESGKKVQLLLQGDHRELRLVVRVNRRHTKKEIKNSLEAVQEKSEGDLRVRTNRFRKRD